MDPKTIETTPSNDSDGWGPDGWKTRIKEFFKRYKEEYDKREADTKDEDIDRE